MKTVLLLLLKHLHDSRLVRSPEIPKDPAYRAIIVTAFQLKIIHEVITLCVFVGFAWLYLGERVKWNQLEYPATMLVRSVAFAWTFSLEKAA